MENKMLLEPVVDALRGGAGGLPLGTPAEEQVRPARVQAAGKIRHALRQGGQLMRQDHHLSGVCEKKDSP